MALHSAGVHGEPSPLGKPMEVAAITGRKTVVMRKRYAHLRADYGYLTLEQAQDARTGYRSQ